MRRRHFKPVADSGGTILARLRQAATVTPALDLSPLGGATSPGLLHE